MSEVKPEPDVDRALRRRAERLSSLKENLGFQTLLEEIEKKRVRMKESLAMRLLDGKEAFDVLHDQARYDRGFYDGAKYAEAIVEGAARAFKKWEDGAEVTEPEEETDGWAGYERDD